jgi:hypothetical protein
VGDINNYCLNNAVSVHVDDQVEQFGARRERASATSSTQG